MNDKKEQPQKKIQLLFCILIIISMFFLPGFKSNTQNHAIKRLPLRATILPDLSGIAWIADDMFLAVHDAKYPEERSLPRASLLQLPSGLDGVRFKPLQPNFQGTKSDDFESIARIPGTQKFLLVESTGDHDTKPFSHRIFLAELIKDRLKIIGMTVWPIDTDNIEGTAVARLNDEFIFIFAERAQGEPNTAIQFARLNLDPLGLDNFETAGVFTCPDLTGSGARPVTAMDVDSEGMIYVASAWDPDDDNGPFKSAVYRIGDVVSNNGHPDVELDAEPETIAVLNGIKVESVAVGEKDPGKKEIFVGTDDENYGGILRPILQD